MEYGKSKKERRYNVSLNVSFHNNLSVKLKKFKLCSKVKKIHDAKPLRAYLFDLQMTFQNIYQL